MRTVLLDQFEDDNAERVLARLDAAGIEHHHKRAGGLTRVLFAGEWGTRVFVDESRLEEARSIAREVLGSSGS